MKLTAFSFLVWRFLVTHTFIHSFTCSIFFELACLLELFFIVVTDIILDVFACGFKRNDVARCIIDKCSISSFITLTTICLCLRWVLCNLLTMFYMKWHQANLSFAIFLINTTIPGAINVFQTAVWLDIHDIVRVLQCVCMYLYQA